MKKGNKSPITGEVPRGRIIFRALALFTLLLLSTLGAAQTPKYADVVYATVGGKALRMDIYHPSSGAGPFPLVVWIHGGGWHSGSYKNPPAYVFELLEKGVAVACVQYRLVSEAGQYGGEPVVFPAQIHDVKGAVRFLRANGSQYGLNPSKIGTWGSSAGGHLSALMGTSNGVSYLEGAVGGNTGHSSAVSAAADYYGPIDFLNLNADVTDPPGSQTDHDAPWSDVSRFIGFSGSGEGIGVLRANQNNSSDPYPELMHKVRQANPITHIRPGCPPMFVYHGTADRTVPVKQSDRLVNALRNAGISVEFTRMETLGHSSTSVVNAQVVDWLRAKLESAAPPPPPAAPTLIVFDFADRQGWSYEGIPSVFTEPGYSSSVGRLSLRATNNRDTFGSWRSPIFAIAGSGPQTESQRTVFGSMSSTSFYALRGTVGSDASSGVVSPNFRSRGSAESFELTTEFVVSSSSIGSLSPASSSGAKNYTSYFTMPASQSRFRIYHDLMELGTDNQVGASNWLQRLEVRSLEESQFQDGRHEATLDFANNTQGWTLRNSSYGWVEGAVTATGLTLGPAKYSGPGAFGYFGSPEGSPPFRLQKGRVYRMRFHVTSEATSERKRALPAFRLRLNDSSLQMAAVLQVESVSDNATLPLAGTTTVYRLYAAAPDELDGNGALVSFDYLYLVDTDNDPMLRITLSRLEVHSYILPN